MADKKKKEICLWLVPTESGRVRKVRISLGMGALLLLSVITTMGLITYVVSDYGRVQISRHLTRQLLGSVTSERNGLLSKNEELQSEVQSLKAVTDRVHVYKDEINKRLKVLSSILESGSPFDPFGKGKSKAAQAKNEPVQGQKGVGGLEVDCGPDGLNSPNCRGEMRAQADFSALGASGFDFEKNGVSSPIDESFIVNLDTYIDVLKFLPIGRPADGYINSGFGVRKSAFSKRWTRHEGIDIAMPYNSNVFATADAVVAQVTRNGSYGLMIDLKHSPRVITRYAHLNKSLVKLGAKVSRGDVIGLVGSSGRSTGPHVHYEVRVDGKVVNPTSLVGLEERLEPGLVMVHE